MTRQRMGNRLFFSSFFFTLVCLLPLHQAQAMVLTYSFEGSVAMISGSAPNPFSIGQTLSGSISYDMSTAASSSGPNNAQYNGAITHLSIAFGSYSVTGSAGDINVENNGLLGDWISVQVPVTGASLNGFHPVTFSAGLHDYAGLAIDGTELGPLPLSSAFDPKTFFLEFTTDETFPPQVSPAFIVSGPITSITPVPVPAAAVLFASGLLSVWGYARQLTGKHS